MFSPTITDMQDKYSKPINKGGGLRLAAATTKEVAIALTKANIVEVTKILVLHVGNGRAEHV